MRKTTQNIKRVTYVCERNSNTTLIVRGKYKEKGRRVGDLFFKVYDV